MHLWLLVERWLGWSGGVQVYNREGKVYCAYSVNFNDLANLWMSIIPFPQWFPQINIVQLQEMSKPLL